MSLNLHSECKSRLKESVADNLAHARVTNDVFLNPYSTTKLSSAEVILPTGKLQKTLNEYISETPLYDFIYESISRDIYENGTYSSNSETFPLSSLTSYRNLQNISNNLVEEFDTLPWSYLISFRLPSDVGIHFRDTVGKYSLSDSMQIVSPDDSYDSILPLQSGIEQRDKILFPRLGLLSFYTPQKWCQKSAFVQFEAKGFIGWYLKTTPIEEVISSIKSLVGLALAVRLFKVKKKQVDPILKTTEMSSLIVHRKINDHWQVWSTFKLPDDLSETLNRLEIISPADDLGSDIINKWTNMQLAAISTAFRNTDKSERILLAGQWLLDSYVGRNELLSFVQTTVAMEILLGDEIKTDIIGIGELLRNRCAYLIGKTYDQRERILKDFEKVYNIRSKIVHRGKSKLNFDESNLFGKLQWMCTRVIAEELSLIAQDKKATP
jgi:hypothetical protein